MCALAVSFCTEIVTIRQLADLFSVEKRLSTYGFSVQRAHALFSEFVGCIIVTVPVKNRTYYITARQSTYRSLGHTACTR